jgi:hypothetical protein
MAHVCQPIYIRLAHRDPPPHDLQFSNSKREPCGSIDHVVIENVRSIEPDSKTAPSNTITGIPGAPLGSILFRDIYLVMPGGAKAIPPVPLERDGGYPQSNEFGQVPAYAFYVRHAHDVTFDHVIVQALKPDVRPWLVNDDARVTTLLCRNLNLP